MGHIFAELQVPGGATSFPNPCVDLTRSVLQYFFYNLVDESEVHKYGRPQTATNETLWQRAVRDNPLPSRLVLAHAIGFEDLKKRIAAQKAQTEAQLAGMKMLKQEINKMTEAHVLKTSPRLSTLSHAQADLQSRITKLVHHLHLFIPSIRSTPIQQDEELLRSKLESIETELRGPGGLGRIGGRVGELWGLVGRVKASREAGKTSLDREGGWAVIDERAFEEIKLILAEEQHGLKFLTELLRTALEDISRIRGGLEDLTVT
ncbi:nucleoporin complex subunit 54-domain-containing protein [Cantharellus anzutake]|uniref:nucleoporin complex subunit 54-domain-containing protein n=1 Tax=Cantharellus anzutake TaxID=1750568 RepID=UPI001907FD0D|nr:nucleoporin complex subunit 54-domain-containing protein [Cantharellus anzutake]KAF8336870.1 nucleoporin complex subunit 54-domain-containing protein [Cantharellus anzutake]